MGPLLSNRIANAVNIRRGERHNIAIPEKNISKVQDGYIYFAENDYTRSADRTKFMLDLLDEATSTRDLKVQLLPFVRNKKLTGAELLLRLRDDSKNALINTYDLIKVAIKNNRIGIITNILIDNIGEYYKNYGFSQLILIAVISMIVHLWILLNT